MGKWSSLKDSIPMETKDPIYRDKVRVERERRKTIDDRPATMLDFVEEYNRLDDEKRKNAEREKEINLALEALTGLINDELKTSGSDIWRGLGYSFSENVSPRPLIIDKAAMLEHFLPLRKLREEVSTIASRSELIARIEDIERRASILSLNSKTLEGMVKAEADAGDLTIEQEEGENGESRTVVKSTIPGVNVFLKSGVNRRKA